MQVSLVITVALALCAVGYSNPSSDCSGTGKWRVECNWCHCKNGRPICTKEPCTGQTVGLQCSGKVTWTKDCSRCQCSDGLPHCAYICSV
ncbi:uncharacterized protein LOC143031992 isoform X2 [Oratosquilla oratoria]|uniref:uncharacterized protein LOC143031991 isoform X2 n=1 Tax=Oratosquilla oratoria TaxID=337810 RepID=UPI003F765981